MRIPAAENLRILVVDDEAPARLRLTDALSKDSEIASIHEARNGKEALAMLGTTKPDLMLLDVQMPGMSGLKLLESIGPEDAPLTVFVTAHDQHAIRAFEANALDYLLKPFSDERLRVMLTRAKERLRSNRLRDFNEGLARMLSASTETEEFADRLAVRSDGLVRLVPVRQIIWIEASGPYVTLHLPEGKLLHRQPLTALARRLDPRRFLRVHRSAVINIDAVVHLEPLSHGEFEITMKDGQSVRVSRTNRAILEARLGETL